VTHTKDDVRLGNVTESTDASMNMDTRTAVTAIFTVIIDRSIAVDDQSVTNTLGAFDGIIDTTHVSFLSI
jgi:hypothetical protein